MTIKFEHDTSRQLSLQGGPEPEVSTLRVSGWPSLVDAAALAGMSGDPAGYVQACVELQQSLSRTQYGHEPRDTLYVLDEDVMQLVSVRVANWTKGFSAFH